MYLTKKSGWKWLWIILFCIIQVSIVYAQGSDDLIKNIIESASRGETRIGKEIVYTENLLAAFYKSNQYRLAWGNQGNIEALITAIKNADREGLNPNEYHLQALEEFYHRKQKTKLDETYFDVLLTDAFLLYSGHLLSGKVDPKVLLARGWEPNTRKADLTSLLSHALCDQTIATALESVKPRHEGYQKLKSALTYYKTLQVSGGWPPIPEGTAIDFGTNDERIPIIRKRLYYSGLSLKDLTDDVNYDSTLLLAIKKFQHQHGLHADGIIGKNTIAALNYSPQDYINFIIVNLERYRWLPEQFGDRSVIVNIPSFSLEVREADSLIHSMKVIVGRPQRKTPVLTSMIRYIILNPTWTVPPTILREDVLPAVNRNINYLAKNNLRVFTRTGEEVDADTLPWTSYTSRNFPYTIRQEPGISSSLGLIKFQFPNHYTVFLHDTNLRSLFGESYRALSSGCIRVEHPFTLAGYLLKNEKTWDANKLNKAILSHKTQTVVVNEPVFIHIVYFTAFVDPADNALNIRNDIYSYDEATLNSLADYSL